MTIAVTRQGSEIFDRLLQDFEPMEILEQIDPEWKNHFQCDADRVLEFYSGMGKKDIRELEKWML